MSKPEDIRQDTIDAVVGLERKFGDGHHSFELREGIFALILAAKAEERRACLDIISTIAGSPSFSVKSTLTLVDSEIRKRGS
jgi:hypothetical protein